MSCSKSTLCSREESWWPMFVQLVYFSRPRLLRKACSRSLLAYKHTNILLFAFKEKGDQRWICMRMRSPRRRHPCLSKAWVARAPFVPAPACQHSLAAHTPDSPIQGPRSSLRSITSLCPVPLWAYTLYYPSQGFTRCVSKAHRTHPNLRMEAEPGGKQRSSRRPSLHPAGSKAGLQSAALNGDLGAKGSEGQDRVTPSLVH